MLAAFIPRLVPREIYVWKGIVILGLLQTITSMAWYLTLVALGGCHFLQVVCS